MNSQNVMPKFCAERRAIWRAAASDATSVAASVAIGCLLVGSDVFGAPAAVHPQPLVGMAAHDGFDMRDDAARAVVHGGLARCVAARRRHAKTRPHGGHDAAV